MPQYSVNRCKIRGRKILNYSTRLLEIHGSGIWSRFHIERAIRFAERYGLTGIVLHCSDMLDRLVKPEKYFEKHESMKFYKNREGDTKNYQYYFSSVLERVKSAGLELYVEEKELNCATEVLSKYPFLRNSDGIICPTDPFWWPFLKEKISEFIRNFPSVDGIILSAGTRESLVSISGNRCTCKRCQEYDIHKWYRELLSSVYRPLSAAGKKLIVRDFAYTADHQYAMIEAAHDVSDEIIMALKNIPHDFYPTFPDNPTVGNCNGMRQWIEFDTWGQFYGMGVFPCSIVDDMLRRIRKYGELGAEGIILRTDWERMLESSSFNSFSMVNLIAGAVAAENPSVDKDEIYDEWLSYGLLNPLVPDSFPQTPYPVSDPHSRKIISRLVDFTWEFLKRTIYIRGHVFNRNTQPFDYYFMVFYIMKTHHSREPWDPGSSSQLIPNDENLEIIFREKDEAVEMADSMNEWFRPEELSVSDEMMEYMRFLPVAFRLFARAMRIECRAALTAERAIEEKNVELKNRVINEELSSVDDIAEGLDHLSKGHCYTNSILYLFDGDRIRRFRDDTIREFEKAFQEEK